LKTQDKLIEFGAIQHPGDEWSWQGRPHSFIGFDEVVQLQEKQVRFLMGWLRSIKPGQRCRVVMASNPPVEAQGDWIVDFFGPWLNPKHPNPAKPGELRWYITDDRNKDVEVSGPEPVVIDGKTYEPLSRTFIPGKLVDNPFLSGTDYNKRLDAMPEPYRSAMRDGNFMLARHDADNQLIPTAWVRDAMARWTPAPPVDVPMCAIAADVAAGGMDETIIAPRYDYWFAPLIVRPGSETPTGTESAGLILSNRRNNCHIIVDMGGGYGLDTMSRLKDNLNPTDHNLLIPYKGAEGSVRKTKDNLVGFYNKRSEAWWLLREALDPAQPGGSPICLPDDPKLLADLTAPTFELTARGYKVESKEDVCEKLGRSTDRGDAVVMCWYGGQRALTSMASWKPARRLGGQRPVVKIGHENKRRK
jgi:hypothetical protein